MQKSLITILKDGKVYSDTWPLRPELSAIFPEFRIIKATNLAIAVMPLLAVLTVVLHYQFLGAAALPQGMAWAVALMSLPLQGLYWLGKRSESLLPPSMIAWYKDVHQRMRDQGCHLQAAKSRPRYVELARLLRKAFDEMDRAFTRDMF